MHKLHRDPVAPICLSHYQHSVDKWSMKSPTPDDRNQIWEKLQAMQGLRCAYCEAPISRGQGKSHIEHFRNRKSFPQGTFDWSNLFGSCDRKETCGHAKDDPKLTGAYDSADLIKPDIEDPDHFFIFIPDGTIQARDNLTDTDLHRARETLRVFQLDSEGGPLRQMRESAVTGHLKTVEEIQLIAAEFPPSEWLPFLQNEIDKTSHLPFATAIRHTLKGAP
jgi:uncharacterized protein (TIGR02646 family)